jgi:type I restriction enzyme S subunit
LIRGITYKKEQSAKAPAPLLKPILRANNISDALSYDDLVYIPKALVSPEQRIKKGDIVFAMSSGSLHLVGKSAQAQADFDGSCGAFCAILRINEKTLSRFAAYQFSANSFRRKISEIAKGSNINNLKREHILEHQIVLPPLKEQQRIVERIEGLFSELDKGIENLKLARAQLAVYRQALLKHAFEGKLTEDWRVANSGRFESGEQLLSRIRVECRRKSSSGCAPQDRDLESEDLPEIPAEWTWARLDWLGTVGSGMSVSKDREIADPVEVPYLRVANVQRGRLDLSAIKTMKVEASILSDLKLVVGDILFNEGGDRDKLGRGWIWEGQIDPCITQNHVFRVTPVACDMVSSKFVSHWGNTFGQQYFLNHGKQTTNLASINKRVLSRLPVPVPSFLEQQQIVAQIETQTSVIDALEAEIDANLQKSEALRQSILKKAFEGDLVPQDASDVPAEILLARLRAERASEQVSAETTKSKARKPRAAKA